MKRVRCILSSAIDTVFSISLLTAQSNDFNILNSTKIEKSSGDANQLIERVKKLKKGYVDTDLIRESSATNYFDLVSKEKGRQMYALWNGTLQNSSSHSYKLEVELSI